MTTELNEMPAIRRYIVIVLAIFLAVTPPVVIVLFRLAQPFGATATLDQLARIQSEQPEKIFLPFDLRYNGAFKLPRVEQERPEIIWFSSSRAGAARASMFEPYRFYNMSFTAWTADQLLDAFERSTRDVRPRVAILELDYFLFTDDWERWFATSRTMIYGRPYHYVQASVGNFVRTAVSRWSLLREIQASRPQFIGTEAILVQEGFRCDGSYVYSPGHIEDARLHYKTGDFFVASTPRAPSLAERPKAPIARLAEMARQRGITLVAVQLPFIRAAVDRLDNDPALRHWMGAWRDFENGGTRSWLESLGIPLFDLARSSIDDDPNNFFDAYHPSEIGMLRVVRELLTDPAFRAEFPAIDPSGIDRQIAAGRSAPCVR
jgi:hypothetical protein